MTVGIKIQSLMLLYFDAQIASLKKQLKACLEPENYLP